MSAFKVGGWQVNHIEGGYYFLINDYGEIHLSIHVHKNKTLDVGLLKKLINKAGMTNEEYIEYFLWEMRILKCPSYAKPAPIPDRHCSCTVVPMWYFALEVCIFKRVVFCLDRKPLDAGFCWRCFFGIQLTQCWGYPELPSNKCGLTANSSPNR